MSETIVTQPIGSIEPPSELTAFLKEFPDTGEMGDRGGEMPGLQLQPQPQTLPQAEIPAELQPVQTPPAVETATPEAPRQEPAAAPASRPAESSPIARGNRRHVPGFVKWGAGIGVVAVGAMVAYNALFGAGDGKGHASPPSHRLPTPEAAIGELGPAKNLDIAFAEFHGVETASFRFTQCLPVIDTFCHDLHLGHDVATIMDSKLRFSADGSGISYGVAHDENNKPYVVVKVSDNQIEADLDDPKVSHPVADNQWLADTAGAVNLDSGIGGAVDASTDAAKNDLQNKITDTIMQAGEEKGDAFAGAIAEAGRQDLARLVTLLQATDADAATVVSKLLAPDKPIGVDFGPDGFTVEHAPKPPEFHYEKLGLHIDVTLGQPKDVKLSAQAAQQEADWTNPEKVRITRYPGQK